MIVISLLFFIYLITIAIFTNAFDKVSDFKKNNLTASTLFSVVIPFRNEAKNLPSLLDSIATLNYSTELVEFIFVDDDSDDNSAHIVNTFIRNSIHQINLIPNVIKSNSPKKDAISLAIQHSKNDWVLTTDADCILPSNWLLDFDNFIQQKNSNMVVGPVIYTSKKSPLHQFQLLDFLSLQASTISGFGLKKPFLCNGANLAYRKDTFIALEGFKNNNSIASGDDIFLLEKFLKFKKEKVHYLKSSEAIVSTKPEDTFYELCNQRVRWASKTTSYKLAFGKLVGLIVFVGNSIFALLPFMVLTGIISSLTALSYLLMKLFFDVLLIERSSSFFNKKISFLTYFFSAILYPYFTLYISIKALLYKYQWKGRVFKK